MPRAATIDFQGQRTTVNALARAHGLLPCTLHYRLDAGWPIDKALATPANTGNRARKQPPKPPVAGMPEVELEQALDERIAHEPGAAMPWENGASNTPVERRAPSAAAAAPGRTLGSGMAEPRARLSAGELRKVLAEVEAVLLATAAVEIRRRDLLANVRRLQRRL